jgi:hypothetical protein
MPDGRDTKNFLSFLTYLLILEKIFALSKIHPIAHENTNK